MPSRSEKISACFKQHQPVLLKHLVSMMKPDEGDIVVDCTLGFGGHAEDFLNKIGETGQFIGIDQDSYALENTKQKLKQKFPKTKQFYIHSNFSDAVSVLKSLDISKIDHLIADLGVSSYQLDTPERGFSYRFDGPLDMRMNQNNSITAEKYLKTVSEENLSIVFSKYGEIKWNISKKLAKIIKSKIDNINSTLDLKQIILNELPNAKGKNILPQIFQAIRIDLNHELESIEYLLNTSFEYLNDGCKIAFISFHSLEDRLIKTFLKKWSRVCVCPKTKPICDCQSEYPKRLKLITKKPITAEQDELEVNPRSRSAKLRIAQVYNI